MIFSQRPQMIFPCREQTSVWMMATLRLELEKVILLFSKSTVFDTYPFAASSYTGINIFFEITAAGISKSLECYYSEDHRYLLYLVGFNQDDSNFSSASQNKTEKKKVRIRIVEKSEKKCHGNTCKWNSKSSKFPCRIINLWTFVSYFGITKYVSHRCHYF